MVNYVEANAHIGKDVDKAGSVEHIRRRVILDERLQILLRTTQGWQRARDQDSFVVDRGRNYFMTVLDKAIEEQGSEEMQRTRYRDAYRVVCVVVE